MKTQKANPLVALVFLLAGVGITVFAGSRYLKARASTSWPTAKGQIASSDIRTSTHTSRRRGRVRGTKKKHTVEVEYRYTVNGKEYTGNRIAFADVGTGSHAKANEIRSRYDVGTEVDVAYKPDEPAVSVLETGTSFDNYLWLGVGALVLVLGVCATVASVINRSGECPASSD